MRPLSSQSSRNTRIVTARHVFGPLAGFFYLDLFYRQMLLSGVPSLTSEPFIFGFIVCSTPDELASRL